MHGAIVVKGKPAGYNPRIKARPAIAVVQYVNQHSFVLTAIFLLAVLAAILFRDGVSRRDLAALAALGAALVVAYFALRVGPDDVRAAEQVTAALSNGVRPTLVEFYSNY